MLHQPRRGYRAATDPVWLAAACPARDGESVLELGCGAGAALCCLGWRTGAALTGLELQPGYAALARRNLAENGLDGEVVEGDLAEMPAELRGRSFDHVIANPPYFATDSLPSPDAGRDTANREATPLATWIDAALRRLKPRGTLTLIHRAERLAGIIAPLEGRAGGILVLPLAPRTGRDAGRVIVQATKGGRAPLRLLAPLIVHEGERHIADAPDFTAVAERILTEGASLSLGEA
ncbi:tRNA1(Val) (adenine(37)-N6)-methyltransferase [Pontivivens ytuae]|uniref:Methyltransferase domain-containing protein n=1 Tax=Pontivivens ytuae TaxID=2789856 RepID=A0A7S9LVT2_9RHOB|nr:methyltransferase domain-containing protein [Pontivivens ytuae]QPH56217.1 methyltransferase domain-containing protein [Pontivivens ytuae]